MIIVSQDRKSIYNFENIKSIDIVDNEIYLTDDILADRGTRIGQYETEERADEVLQEIIKHYNLLKKASVYAMGDSGFIFEEKFYYEMPKEW